MLLAVQPKPTCENIDQIQSVNLVLLLSHFGTSRWLHLEAGRMGKRGASSTPPSNGKSIKVDQSPWVSKMALILENLALKNPKGFQKVFQPQLRNTRPPHYILFCCDNSDSL